MIPVGQDLSWQIAPGQVLAYIYIDSNNKVGNPLVPRERISLA